LYGPPRVPEHQCGGRRCVRGRGRNATVAAFIVARMDCFGARAMRVTFRVTSAAYVSPVDLSLFLFLSLFLSLAHAHALTHPHSLNFSLL
jgi:hypothetical protein